MSPTENADVKLPNKLLGLGAIILGFDRLAVDDVEPEGLPSLVGLNCLTIGAVPVGLAAANGRFRVRRVDRPFCDR